TWSDAGSVYLVNKTDSANQLLFKVVQNDSLPNLPFEEFTIPLTLKSLAGYVALTGKPLNIPDAYKISGNVPYQLDRSFDHDFSYRTCSVLVLPMQDQEGEVIGVLQLINRKKHPHVMISPENAIAVTQPYSEWEERVLCSLASQAAISIERNLLQESIENLFEGFVKASVELIELRDPTTSGHSERVAMLSVRLGQEINDISSGRLRSIEFSDRQIQEIRYAALLHDFGKVCVPETILNKRKKLYPEQLQMIRQRFALAQRTLEVECAEKKFQYLIENPHSANNHAPSSHCVHCQHLEKFEQERLEAIATLEEYLSLIEEINEPEAIQTKRFEAFSEEAFAKLTALSEYTYRDIDGQIKPLIHPEEMEQLLIPRGNLTPLERLAIEAHVTHNSYNAFLGQKPSKMFL
ncbi:MAG: GAF and HD-GYP domain-containing protein, partial [Chroococcales cyanobacterium]